MSVRVLFSVSFSLIAIFIALLFYHCCFAAIHPNNTYDLLLYIHYLPLFQAGNQQHESKKEKQTPQCEFNMRTCTIHKLSMAWKSLGLCVYMCAGVCSWQLTNSATVGMRPGRKKETINECSFSFSFSNHMWMYYRCIISKIDGAGAFGIRVYIHSFIEATEEKTSFIH